MMNLVERETDRYEELINGMPEYLENSPGEMHAELFLEMSGAQPGDTILDVGCCSVKGSVKLAEYQLVPQLQDITDVGLVPEAQAFPFDKGAAWAPRRARSVDWIFCTDLMEHIPTAFVMLTLDRLCRRARKGAFFTISLQPDNFGVYIGEPLHLTVQPYVWWRERIKDVAPMRDSRDYLATGIYLTDGQS